MASKVYFADFRCPSWRENLQQKLARLMMTAGFGDIDMDGKYVAIKMHFGEPGNMAYLRPNWAKTVADLVKSQGGKPFLTDCNTLYIGGRKNALDHMESAYVNGFTPYSTGCHIIIADGLKGNDEVAVPVEGGEYVKEAKIGRAVMDADVFISLTHFKGHEQAGIGGCAEKHRHGLRLPGRQDGAAQLRQALCQAEKVHRLPGLRQDLRPRRAPSSVPTARPPSTRTSAWAAPGALPSAPRTPSSACMTRRPAILNKKIAEYTKAVVDGRPCFHVSLVVDVSPNCDCHGENDVPIVPNVGMFASFDPVALDQACVDAVLAQPKMPNSVIGSGEACTVRGLLQGRSSGHRLGSRSDPQREDRSGQPGIRAGEDLDLANRPPGLDTGEDACYIDRSQNSVLNGKSTVYPMGREGASPAESVPAAGHGKCVRERGGCRCPPVCPRYGP